MIAELGPEIRWLESYVTDDKMYCVYVASGEDIILEHARARASPPIGSRGSLTLPIRPGGSSPRRGRAIRPFQSSRLEKAGACVPVGSEARSRALLLRADQHSAWHAGAALPAGGAAVTIPAMDDDASAAIAIRPWDRRDRNAVQGLLRLLSRDPEVTADAAPTYVATSGERVVGMVTLCVFRTLTGPKAYLDHLVVAPEWQRRGSGAPSSGTPFRKLGRQAHHVST